jgi:hypothetical protein
VLAAAVLVAAAVVVDAAATKPLLPLRA